MPKPAPVMIATRPSSRPIRTLLYTITTQPHTQTALRRTARSPAQTPDRAVGATRSGRQVRVERRDDLAPDDRHARGRQVRDDLHTVLERTLDEPRQHRHGPS